MALEPQSPFAGLWTLDPAVAYLNHGSFGACPRALLEHQWALRQELEREPVDFLSRQWPARSEAVRAALGAFVGARPEDLALVTNATSGVNAVLRSLDLQPGDELLTNDHAYMACRRTLDYVCARTGARVVTVRLPFPVNGPGALVADMLAAVTPRTRLALLDHVSSPTALVFPLEQLVPALHERGVDTLVDGAHALGMLPLELDRLGAAYYTANAHKWLCAPKGAAFLHVRADRQQRIHPLTISHGYELRRQGERYRAEFDWTGTSDPTAWLTIPECVRYLGGLLPGGWPELMARNRALALEARALLCAGLDVPEPCPQELIGSMASLPLPEPAPGSPVAVLQNEPLIDWFRERGVETWLFPWQGPGGRLMRISAQLYNHRGEYERLAGLLRQALGRTGG